MQQQLLPVDPFTCDNYDVVVLGTGLVECIVAAAVARAGRRVLLCDSSAFYGGNEASLSVTELGSIAKDARQFACKVAERMPGPLPRVQVDLAPLLMKSRGIAVDVLAESGVSRYLEMHAVEGTFFFDAGKPIRVPHAKADVFTSKDLSLVDKRQLMRFLHMCRVTHDELDPGRALPKPQNPSEPGLPSPDTASSFESYLTEQVALSPRLSSVVRFGVALLSRDVAHKAHVGMDRVSDYLGSIGRFGPTPYILPSYGTGDVSQAFSRLCAVYGGVCALDSRISRVSLQDSLAVEFARSTDRPGLPQRVSCKALVIGDALVGEPTEEATKTWTSSGLALCRVAMLCNAPLLVGAPRACMVIPPRENGDFAVHCVQLDSVVGACPQGQFVFYLSTLASSDLQSETLARLQTLATDMAPETLECRLLASFSHQLLLPHTFLAPNIYSASVFEEEPLVIDMDAAFTRAKALFESICPDEAFLPASQSETASRNDEQTDLI